MDSAYDQFAATATGIVCNPVQLGVEFKNLPVSEEQRCRYPSKRCELPRGIKRNGEMHRFCDVHRAKANENQRRLEQRRRQEMRGVDNNLRQGSVSSPGGLDFTEWSGKSHAQPLEPTAPLHTTMGEDELKFLDELLAQNDLELLSDEDQGLVSVPGVFDSRTPPFC